MNKFKSKVVNKEEANEIMASLGSRILNFKSDSTIGGYNGVLHSQPRSWQVVGGFNNFYDVVFKFGTNNNVSKEKFPFAVGDTEYIVWVWKADYMNLGIGSEFGIYKIAQKDEYELFNGNKFEEFTVVDHNRKMTNSTYYYTTNIADWQPEEPIWWATAFNPAYKNKRISDIQNTYVLGSIDFSATENDKAMYECFKHNVNESDKNGNDNGIINKNNQEFHAKDSLIFDDDNYIVWLLWWGNEQNEYKN